MIGEIKEIKIDDKKFEIEKQGVKMCLEIQSVFIELVYKAGMIDKNADNNEMATLLMVGMRGKILDDIERILKKCVISPKMTEKAFNEINPRSVPNLFMEIYFHNLAEAEKKSS